MMTLPLFYERKEKEIVNKISKKLNEIVPDSIWSSTIL